jgi:hypothetical protein
MAKYIAAIAWAHLSADRELIRKTFLNCGSFIHSDGRKDHLLSIKGVDNTAIDTNGWFGYLAVGKALDAHTTIPDDDNLTTALVSATEGVSIKNVTQKQLQAECARQGIPRSGTKPELFARLQTHEAGGRQRTGHKPGEEDEFATISTHITLGKPMPSSPFSSPPSSPNED